MPITVDSLRNLAENQSVMLNAQTLDLERSSRSLRFRSAFRTSGAKATNALTLAAIRRAVVSDPRYNCVRQRADALFDQIDRTKLVQTNVIRSLVADLDAARELHGVDLRAWTLERLRNDPAVALPAAAHAHPEAALNLVNHLIADHAARANGDLGTLTAQALATEVAEVFDAIEAAADGDAAVADWAVRHLAADPAAFATPGAATDRVNAYRMALQYLGNAAATIGAAPFADLPTGPALTDARATGAALLRMLSSLSPATVVADTPRIAAGVGSPEEARAVIARTVCANLPAETQRALFDALTSTGGIQLARFCQEAATPHATALFADARALADELRARLGEGSDFAATVAETPLDAAQVPTKAFALSLTKSLLMGAAGEAATRAAGWVRALPVAQDPVAFNAHVRTYVQDAMRESFRRELAKMGDHPNGSETVFAKDIVRSMHVTLPNGQRLANDLAEAKDQIARYVAHDEQATFAALAPAHRARAEQIMALCNQEPEKIVLHYAAEMFKNERGQGLFDFMAGFTGSVRSFTLTEQPGGSLGFVYEAEIPVQALLDDKMGIHLVGEASRQRTRLEYAVANDGTLSVGSVAVGITAVPAESQHARDMRTFNELPAALGLTSAETDRLATLRDRETARGTDLDTFNTLMRNPNSTLRRLFSHPALLRDAATYNQAVALLGRFDAAYAQLAAGDAAKFPPDAKWFLERLVFDDLARELEAGGKLPKPSSFGKALKASHPFAAFMGTACHAAAVGCSVLAMPAQYREPVVRALALMDGAHSPGVLNRLIGKRDDLFALAVRGKLTRDNVLKACWGDPIPQSIRNALAVKDAKQRTKAFTSALDYGDADRLAAIGVANTSPRFAACLETIWKYGVDAQTALDIVEERVPAPDQVLNPFEPMVVISIREAQNPVAAEGSLAKDLHRMADGFTDTATKQRALGGVPSTFSFLLPDGHALNLDSSANGLTAEDAEARSGGHPYSVSRQIREAAVRLCGEAHPMQAANVILGLAQGCVAPLRTMSGAFGITASEHSQAQFRVEAVRDEHDRPTGDVAVHVTNLPGCPLVFDWAVTVHPDGSQDLSPVTMHRAAADA